MKKLTESGQNGGGGASSSRLPEKKHIAEIKLSDLQVKYEAKVKELEELNRRYVTLKKKYDESGTQSSRNNSSGGSGSQDELIRLKKLDQDRENILKEVELRNEQLREVEAKLRSTQIELESVESEKKLA